jgi:hypothetical protein
VNDRPDSANFSFKENVLAVSRGRMSAGIFTVLYYAAFYGYQYSASFLSKLNQTLLPLITFYAFKPTAFTSGTKSATAFI